MNSITENSFNIEPSMGSVHTVKESAENHNVFQCVIDTMDKVFARIKSNAFSKEDLAYFPKKGSMPGLYEAEVYYKQEFVSAYTINEDDASDSAFIQEMATEIQQMIEDNLETLEESATKMYKDKGDITTNHTLCYVVLDQNDEDTLLQKVVLDDKGEIKERCKNYVIAWGLQPDGSWNQGHYFTDEDAAKKAFKDRFKARLTESSSSDSFESKAKSNTTACTLMKIVENYGYKCDVPYIQNTGGIHLNIQAVEKYQPEIYWYPAKRGTTGTLKISNKAYGSLELSEYEKVLKACQSAFKMCTEIMNIDLSNLEQEPADEE